MKPVLTAATLVAAVGFLVAAIGFATTHAADSTNAADSRPDIKVIASELANSLIVGIILGANVGPHPSVGPYPYGLTPAQIEWRVMASGYAPAQQTDSNSVANK